MTSKIIKFTEFTPTELYDCLALRFNVFVIEQECMYPEFDAIDKKALHLLAHKDTELVGYLRIYIDSNNYARIGRIVIDPNFREKSYGKKIINEAITYIKDFHTNKTIKINAQEHLNMYYQSFGFKQIGVSYLDYGIPHIDMVLNIK